MRRTMAVALGLVALAGCLGGGEDAQRKGDAGAAVGDASEGSDIEDSCHRQQQSNRLSPTEPLSVTTNASVTPSRVEVHFEAGPFVGPVDLVLEHDGEAVWEFSTVVAGNYDGILHDGQTAEDYDDWTFTATTDAGAGQALVRLQIESDEGCE